MSQESKPKIAKDLKERIILQRELIDKSKEKIVKIENAIKEHEKALMKLQFELEYQKHEKGD